MGSVSKCNSNPCCGDPVYCVRPPQFERPAAPSGSNPFAPYGSKQAEYNRSAELFIDLANGNAPIGGGAGPFYALALLQDIGYDRHDIQQILNVMQDMPGAIK